MNKKKFGDRRDAARIKMTGFDKILNNFKDGNRSEGELFILKTIDLTELIKYKEKKKKENLNFTYFHLFATAIAKTIYNRPQLNTYIIGGKKYQRHDVTISFVAKTEFSDTAKENLSVIKVLKDDNINTLSKKIVAKVNGVRKNEENDTDAFVNKVNNFPHWLINIMGWGVRILDKHDLLPKALIENNIYHSSIILSDLGCIKCDAIYHNLTNFGTNSIICTIGEVREEPVVINGKIKVRQVCDFGVTLDERIADGYYFAKSLNLFKFIIANPTLLEGNASDKISMN